MADFRYHRHHGCKFLTVKSKGSWLSCCIPHQVLRQTPCRPGISSQWTVSVYCSCFLAMKVHMLQSLCSLWHRQTTTWCFSQDAQLDSTAPSLKVQPLPGPGKGCLDRRGSPGDSDLSRLCLGTVPGGLVYGPTWQSAV